MDWHVPSFAETRSWKNLEQNIPKTFVVHGVRGAEAPIRLRDLPCSRRTSSFVP